MSTKAKVLIALTALGVVDAVALGLPIIALVLVYVVLDKPMWFYELVQVVYHG